MPQCVLVIKGSGSFSKCEFVYLLYCTTVTLTQARMLISYSRPLQNVNTSLICVGADICLLFYNAVPFI